MKICFLVELPKGIWQWQDGLRAALNLLADEHDICYHLDGRLLEHKPDLLMAWGGSISPTTRQAREYQGKSILFFAGGGIETSFFDGIDLVLFENQLHTDEARVKGIRCQTAFGTDTQTFKPMKQPKVFDVIYPAAFGLWKRKDLFAKAVNGLTALTLGNIQEQEPECFDVCVDNNVAVSSDIPQEVLPYFYNMSKICLITTTPEIGGQRTALEAMSCGLPVVYTKDSVLVAELVNGHGVSVDPDPIDIKRVLMLMLSGYSKLDKNQARDYILRNYSEKHYADKIRSAISQC